jgi:hypothetical protein
MLCLGEVSRLCFVGGCGDCGPAPFRLDGAAGVALALPAGEVSSRYGRARPAPCVPCRLQLVAQTSIFRERLDRISHLRNRGG